MNVELRLFASLRKFLPPGSPRGKCFLELPPETSLGDLLSQLRIPQRKAHLVLINGLHGRDFERLLSEQDVVSVFPPVAGG